MDGVTPHWICISVQETIFCRRLRVIHTSRFFRCNFLSQLEIRSLCLLLFTTFRLNFTYLLCFCPPFSEKIPNSVVIVNIFSLITLYRKICAIKKETVKSSEKRNGNFYSFDDWLAAILVRSLILHCRWQ